MPTATLTSSARTIGRTAPPDNEYRVEPMIMPIRYCLYARKSSEDDERQAMSIDSQVKEMLALAKRDGMEIAEIRRESHSAKASGHRPVYNTIIEDIKKGVVSGEDGLLNAYKRKRDTMQAWQKEKNTNVRKFAEEYEKSLNYSIADEQRRKDEELTLLKKGII